MPKVQYTDFYSHILGMSLKLEITGEWGFPILMFPTTKGSYLQNRDFGLNDSVKWFTENGKVKLYNIETIDTKSLYARNLTPYQRIYNYNKYHEFLVREFIPFMQRENRTHRVGTAGCSFGGYHAADLAFRNPDLISHLFSLSGAFNIRDMVEGTGSDMVYFHNPNEFMPNEQPWRYQHMNLVLGVGEYDICLNKNLNMAGILHAKGIPHTLDIKRWANHDWPLWNRMFPEYLGWYF